jgi:hypothetical protein
LIFLLAWIGVVIVGVREFKDGGLLQNVLRIKEGDLFPLLLVAVSVVLLALLIRSFVLYFQSAVNHEDQDT